VVVVQIFSGGLMAGSMAGFMWQSWPLMGDYLVPPGLMAENMGFIRNFVENKVMIQFFHRWFAFATLAVVLVLVARAMTVRVSPVARWALRAVASVTVLQIIVGIVTLLTGVQTHAALTHQAIGLVLMLNVLVVVYETAGHPVVAEAAQMAEQNAVSRETVNA
jgi:cytochrome c oxidase assembly protein subunit 15